MTWKQAWEEAQKILAYSPRWKRYGPYIIGLVVWAKWGAMKIDYGDQNYFNKISPRWQMFFVLLPVILGHVLVLSWMLLEYNK